MKVLHWLRGEILQPPLKINIPSENKFLPPNIFSHKNLIYERVTTTHNDPLWGKTLVVKFNKSSYQKIGFSFLSTGLGCRWPVSFVKVLLSGKLY